MRVGVDVGLGRIGHGSVLEIGRRVRAAGPRGASARVRASRRAALPRGILARVGCWLRAPARRDRERDGERDANDTSGTEHSSHGIT